MPWWFLLPLYCTECVCEQCDIANLKFCTTKLLELEIKEQLIITECVIENTGVCVFLFFF